MTGRWGGDRWVAARWSGTVRPAVSTFAATAADATLAGSFAFTVAPAAAFDITATTDDATLASGYAMVGLPAEFGLAASTAATLAGTFAYTAPGMVGFALIATAGGATLASSFARTVPTPAAATVAATTAAATLASNYGFVPRPAEAAFAASAAATLASSYAFATAPASVLAVAATTTATLASGYTMVGLPAEFGFGAATSAALGGRFYFVIPELGLKPAIVAALLASEDITAMTSTRIYPYVIPQAVARGLPSIAYWFIGTERDRPMNDTTDPARWPLTRVRFHIQSSKYTEVKTLTTRLRNRFLGQPGHISGIRVAFVTAENDADGYDPPLSGGGLGMYFVEFDLRFKHQEIATPYTGPEAEGDTIEEVVVSALLTSADVAELVGTRIYPYAIPQEVAKGVPSVAYWLVSTLRESGLAGPTGWSFVRIRFRVQSSRVDQVEALKYHVRNRFQWMPDDTGTPRVSFLVSENDNDGYDPPLQGGDLGTYYAQFDLRFKHHEEIPTHV